MDGQVILDAAFLPALFFAAFGGLVSFLSPCVLPIVPPYLGYMAGITPSEMAAGQRRARAFSAAVMFVLGLSTVFLLMGLAASALGRQVLQYRDGLATAAGILIMIFGAHFVGVFRIGFLDRDIRPQAGKGGTALGAYALGLAFAFGWTPCIGPFLGAILSIAATQASLAKGIMLLGVYAAGLGLPFLLVALFFPAMSPVMRFMTRHMGRIEKISGLLLWTTGLMIATGQFTDLSNWLLDQFPAMAAFG